MTPYLRAFEVYGKADRGVSWTDALDYHLQFGAVVSTPEFFAMLRPVELFWDDVEHTAMNCRAPHSDVWHVWTLAGDLKAALAMACQHGITWVTFQRHGGSRVHRAALAQLMGKLKNQKIS